MKIETTQWICDRCGKQYIHNHKPILGRISISRKKHKQIQQLHKNDLCSDCYKEYQNTFTEFMSKGTTKNRKPATVPTL